MNLIRKLLGAGQRRRLPTSDAGLLVDLQPGDWEKALDRVARFYEAEGLSASAPASGAPALVPENEGLEAIGEKHKPSRLIHNYLLRYDHVFGRIRKDVRTMVEIGVQSARSVRVWKDYFPNAEIIGIDIDEACRAFEEERIRIVVGDQNDLGFLTRFAREHFGRIDILVDDGAHTPDAIFRSFAMLYPALNPHGIYGIEDFLYGPQWVHAPIIQLISGINHWPEGFSQRRWPILNDLGPHASWLARNTVGIEFYRYILFVKRGINPGDNSYLQNEQAFYDNLNRRMADVVAAASRLEVRGERVTRQNLRAELGEAYRFSIGDFLSGIRDYGPDTRF